MSILKYVTKTAITKMAKSAVNYVVISANAEKTLNIVGDKISDAANRVSGERSANEIIDLGLFCNYLIVKQGTKVIDYEFGEVEYADKYVIEDTEGSVKYTVTGGLVLGKHNFVIKDENDIAFGNITKRIIPKIEFLEAKAEEVVLSLEDGWKMVVRSYYTLNDWATSFDTREFRFEPDEWAFTIVEENKSYAILYDGCVVANFDKVGSVMTDKCKDKYVLGYNEDDDELGVVLMSMVIDILLHGNKEK